MNKPASSARAWLSALTVRARTLLRHGGHRRALAVALALVLIASALFVMYVEEKKRAVPRAIAALVRDSGSRLQDGLQNAHTEGLEARAALEAHYAKVDAHLKTLRAMDARAHEEFARAADDYVLTVREILRRVAADHRHRVDLSESVRALQTHMRADNRTGVWITQAVQKRERLETEYRAYRKTAEALAGLLAQYAESRERLARHFDPSLLPEGGLVGAARERVLATLRATVQDVERAGELAVYR